jgi:hypothetical protein
MAMFDTALNIINAASQELGIGVVSLNASSTGNAGYQLLGILNALGEELVRVHDWQNLEKTVDFVGDGVTDSFPLPADWGRQVNQTAWSTSLRQPMIGVLNSQQWSWCNYGIIGTGIYYRYRILDGQFTVFPVPEAGATFSMYYISRNWVKAQDQSTAPPTVYADKVVAGGDIPQFDRRLLINGVKAKFWAQKGFDTTMLQREFNDSLIAEKGQNQGAPMVSLVGGSGFRLVGAQNVPDGSWVV